MARSTLGLVPVDPKTLEEQCSRAIECVTASKQQSEQEAWDKHQVELAGYSALSAWSRFWSSAPRAPDADGFNGGNVFSTIWFIKERYCDFVKDVKALRRVARGTERDVLVNAKTYSAILSWIKE